MNKEEDEIVVEVALQYTDGMDEDVRCYTNNIVNPEGGTHLAGFRTAITSALNNYAQKSELLKGVDGTLSGDDVREGLTAIVSVKVADPQFEGQTKIKLNNREVKSVVSKLVRDELLTYFEENPQEAKNVIGKAVLANKAKAAAKAARDAVIRKNALESTTLPGKLADCTSNDPSDSELFIVEGDSAGGSAKQGRDRHTQAILPLRGKIMNTHKYRVDRVLSNNEFNDVTTALGVGIGDTLDISKLRYHKIVIMSDADVDGLHITTLVLTLLFRFFRPLIEQGYVYVAQPPLHKVEIGKKKYYFINDQEKDVFVKKAKAAGKVPVENRFKGLGEMNPDQLWETTMNPETRVLKRVEIQDLEEVEKTFEMLMGSEVPPRRRFIQMHATKANLDI
jgi:DNA gyrase subunit B